MRHIAFTVTLLSLCLAWGAQESPQAIAVPKPEKVVQMPEPAGPAVEVVFVLDTTGSMSDLIQAAKEKIWAIANTLAMAKPSPDIKMGLVGYRDRGDDYVTKVTNLTNDLDAVYNTLMEYQANGGNDTPESVNQALHEAITKLAWSKDPDTYRVVFLVGDAPPHMDYQDDVKYLDTCKKAAGLGIYINTIQCGSIGETTPIWREIAAKAEGRYFRVEQSGNAILAETPFDDELADLAEKLDETCLYYGSAAAQTEMRARKSRAAVAMDAAPASAKAGRAFFNASGAGKANLLGRQELVNDFAEGKVDLSDLDGEELPEELRAVAPEKQEALLREKAKEREELSARIQELSEKRQAHMRKQLEKNSLDGKGTLDYSIFECIKAQGGKTGLRYSEAGPSL